MKICSYRSAVIPPDEPASPGQRRSQRRANRARAAGVVLVVLGAASLAASLFLRHMPGYASLALLAMGFLTLARGHKPSDEPG
jgi:hypothetical protein